MRSEAARAEGYFLVPFRGGEVRLSELSWGEASDWALASSTAFGPVFAEFEREWKPGDGLIGVELGNQAAMGVIVARIAAYDTEKVLGGEAGIKKRLRGEQIHALYQELYAASHPFDADLQAALMQMATLRVNAALAAQLAGVSSTPGSPATGTSLLGRRGPNSPLRNLKSSGKRSSGSNSEPPPSASA